MSLPHAWKNCARMTPCASGRFFCLKAAFCSPEFDDRFYDWRGVFAKEKQVKALRCAGTAFFPFAISGRMTIFSVKLNGMDLKTKWGSGHRRVRMPSQR